jgi:hypothetical protein
MARLSERCGLCRSQLVSVLVYKGGNRRRVRATQCPKHCDQKCPQCDSTIPISLKGGIFNLLNCRKCNWSGTIEFEALAKVEFEKLKSKVLLRENQSRWRKIPVAKGSPCHLCGRSLVESSIVSQPKDERQRTISYKLFCGNRKCKWIAHEEEITQWQTVNGNWSLSKVVPRVSTYCAACERVLDEYFRCGCN